CAGANFKAHTDAMYARNFAGAAAMAANLASKPFIWGFWKVGREATATGEDVIYPARATRLDYEGEIAIVLGRKGKDIAARELAQYVWGVTLFADWSVRAPREPAGPQTFSPQKNFDTSYSMGPCIVVGELDPMDIQIQTFVNSECRQDFNTKEMTFSFGALLQHLSRDFTLHPGDVIASGTSEGTAADSSDVLPDGTQPNDRFLKPGDLVTFKASGIGEITNRIVQKPPRREAGDR
ncbi:MAG: fumarylacetoacetate hydrolase family protein, partial [Lautropia sp.]